MSLRLRFCQPGMRRHSVALSHASDDGLQTAPQPDFHALMVLILRHGFL